MDIITERPWGTYEVLLDADNCKVKRIIVKPGEQLSYQYHYHRDEVWVIIQGQAEIILDDVVHNYEEGGIVTIKKLQKHRVKNTGDIDLIFIETQTGNSFDEEDIVRIQDNYGRTDG